MLICSFAQSYNSDFAFSKAVHQQTICHFASGRNGQPGARCFARSSDRRTVYQCVAGYQFVISGKKEQSKPKADQSESDQSESDQKEKHSTCIKIKKPKYEGHLSNVEMGLMRLTMLDYSAYPATCEQGFMN